MRRSLAPLVSAACLAACFAPPSPAGTAGTADTTDTGDPPVTTTAAPPTTGDATTGDATTGDATTAPLPDLPPASPTCADLGTCDQVDILFVVDNSETMAQEQSQLARDAAQLIAGLRALELDVNLMITTTDVGAPLCSAVMKPDYVPAAGAPVATACVDRLAGFTPIDVGDPPEPAACTNNCTQSIVPAGPFIRFAGLDHNIVGGEQAPDPVAAALGCLLPQGLDGCFLESPLEAMRLALDPEAAWNTGDDPFLRPGAALAIVLVGDETDCSIADQQYFDPANKTDPTYNKYWADDPAMPGTKSQPTSAICWNGAMDCAPLDEGIHPSCVPVDRGVLHPVGDYIDLLRGRMSINGDRRVVMLALTGVPPVTNRNPSPPFEPTEGGFAGLVHRPWLEADILPNDPDTAADKQFELGIGPGCVDPAVGYAVPPGRIAEVCRALDTDGQVRCCLESVCATDYIGAFACLAGVIDLQTG